MSDTVVITGGVGGLVIIHADAAQSVSISDSGINSINSVEIATAGPQGPKGLKGGPGIPGQTGTASGYMHTQYNSSSVWVIDRILGKYPSVTILDSVGDECEGDILYPSMSRFVVTFFDAFGGKAFLN